MKKQNGHLHALSLYEKVSYKHFLYLLISILYGKLIFSKSITTHLPLELQHPKVFKNNKLAIKLIEFGEFLKKILKVRLYWENAPLLNYGTWDLKHGQTDWTLVPKNIDLCLDTGHLMLGAKSKNIALKRIKSVLKKRNDQIKHLHISENNLTHDQHEIPGEILSKDLINEITKGKTFIYED